MLLNAQNLEKYYADRLIFAAGSLKVYRGDRIGIVGANGAGKSTLLKVLCGRVRPDKGSVDIRCDIAYVDQLSQEAQTPDDIQSSIFHAKEGAKSGGEIMRKKLAAAFSAPLDILALDEPTSNLDAEGIEILNGMLSGVETLLLISHDRRLLDTHCNKIVEVADGKLTVFAGGWTEYNQAAQALRERQKTLYEEYSREKRRLENSIKEVSARASKVKKAPSRMGNSEARLHKREASAKQSKILSAGGAIATRLNQLTPYDRPKETRPIKADFSLTNPPHSKTVLSCSNLNFSYGGGAELFQNAKFEILNGSHTALLGPNGCGKTTLLQLICDCPDLIQRAPKVKIGYMSQTFCNLDFGASILQNVLDGAVQSQTICRTTLANMGFVGDDVHKSVSLLSGGELIKTSLSKLILSEFNLLVLDEPTNYLDLPSLLQVQSALSLYEGTLLFTSHDSAFVDAVATHTLRISNKQIHSV